MVNYSTLFENKNTPLVEKDTFSKKFEQLTAIRGKKDCFSTLIEKMNTPQNR